VKKEYAEIEKETEKESEREIKRKKTEGGREREREREGGRVGGKRKFFAHFKTFRWAVVCSGVGRSCILCRKK
jgi:hypothetical protein